MVDLDILQGTDVSKQTDEVHFAVLLVGHNQEVVVSILDNKGYTLEEVANEKMFCTYQHGNQNILFYAMFTEEGQWDRDCLTNTYEDGLLVNITEAQYDKGTLQSYKQVTSFANSSGKSAWSVSDRIVIDEETISGENYTYFKTEECSQKFRTPVIDDLLYAEDFQKGIVLY